MKPLLTRQDIPADAITVSPSQIASWHKCQWAWKLAKIDGVEVISDREFGAASLGRTFHAFLDWLYQHSIGRAVGKLSPAGQKMALDAVAAHVEQDANFWKVYTIFTSYCEWAKVREELVPVGSEVEVFAPTGLVSRDGRDIYLHGIIDLLANFYDQFMVVDHKSHTNKPWDRARLMYEIQFKIYCIILELQGIEVDGVCVNTADLQVPTNPKLFNPEFVKTKEGPRPRFQRFMLPKAELNLQFYMEQVLKTIKKMWVDDPTYEMKLGDNCQYCRYRAHIDLDANGAGSTAVVALRQRFADPGDFELEDDIGEVTQDVTGHYLQGDD